MISIHPYKYWTDCPVDEFLFFYLKLCFAAKSVKLDFRIENENSILQIHNLLSPRYPSPFFKFSNLQTPRCKY